VRGLQLLLDPDAAPFEDGDALPALWHWVALPRWTDPSATGHDGHPKRPGPLADVTAVRRMFAGGEVTFTDTPLRVGEEVTVDTEVAGVTAKSGRSGDFVLATFTSRVSNAAGEVVITERQEVVYTDPRPAPAGVDVPEGALPIVGRPVIPLEDGGFALVTDPTILMRFSALTANGHRIHYDLGYAREVEMLPGLLVHGPFMNLALAHTACATRPGERVRRITHRNLSPLYCGQPARLAAHEQEPGVVTAEITGPGDEATVVKGRLTVEFSVRSTSPAEDGSTARAGPLGPAPRSAAD
jgi:3-methylfumaryl-CoA hydratase